MPNLSYLIPRVIRHFLPEPAVSFLLERGYIIKGGLETISPELAAQRYQDVLQQNGLTISTKRVMVFGYGGNLAIGCLLLKAGAYQAILCEREGFPQASNQDELIRQFPKYFHDEKGNMMPNPVFLSIYHRDVTRLAQEKPFSPVDLLVTSSVYEHLQQPEKITKSLAQLTNAHGSQLHFIDLRDHFFTYPFEMLCYSEPAWQKWLNPSSNLNRWRIKDYEEVFQKYFSRVNIHYDENDLSEFLRIKDRIQPEFLSGNDENDSVTQISVIASNPK